MGIINGSATITRYKIEGDLPPGFKDFIDERIRRFAFRDIEEGTEELAVGWTSAHDMLDTDFAFASYALDPFIMLGMRVDRRKVSAAALTKYTRIETAKVRDLREGRKPARAERLEIKERVRLVLLRGTRPASKLFEVCWDTARGEVWFGNASQANLDLFTDLFRRSFDLGLKPLEQPHPADEPLPGQEFLTWLWYLSEEADAPEMTKGHGVEVMLGDRLVLAPPPGQEGSQVTVKDSEGDLAEAREALRQGKRVECLRLGLSVDGEEFWLTLRASGLGASALRMPPAAGQEDGPEGQVLERVALLQEVLGSLDRLFANFQALRQKDDGAALSQSLEAWFQRED
ncbi:MAG: recombination-associated protein RdgC [Deltaproteobacteria bacterium]|nr:recombination-associated protein RdgC [Deltaproteobacteria bacterium]